jgi:hypothetical protein
MSGADFGYARAMLNPQLEDKAMGLELEIEELVERRQRALRQGFAADASRLESEIESLQGDLAMIAERLVGVMPG